MKASWIETCLSQGRETGGPKTDYGWAAHWLYGLLFLLGSLGLVACGGSAAESDEATATGQLCKPGPSDSGGVTDVVDGRQGETLVKFLTGFDELARDESQEGAEIIYDDPNFGGVWGDFNGGWVVAVLDCTHVDLDEVAHIAGGVDRVRIIEVSHTFEQIDSFRDQLGTELRASGINAAVQIDSTLIGRHITVNIEDLDQVPPGFGKTVPRHLLTVQQGPSAELAGN